MGKSIYLALLKVMNKKNIRICDKNLSAEKYIPASCVCKNAANLFKSCDYVILAVKPQDFVDLAAEIKGTDLGKKIVISIMAGITTNTIGKLLGTKKVVRTMPNLPLKVSRGITGWYQSKEIGKNESAFIKKIISAWGREFEVKKEEILNGVTALSGSGPAYFYLLAELMEETARSFGLNKKYSDLIARETFIGAAKLLDSSALPIEKLRESITSKGGTTAAAINSFLENNFAGVVKNGIIKAQKRSEELSK